MKDISPHLDSTGGEPLVRPPARVSVLGAGRSGLAAARLLINQGYRVYLSDIRDNQTLREQCSPLTGQGVEITLGHHDSGLLGRSDFIVISPGIPESLEVLKTPNVHEIPLYSEVEVACWFCPAPIVAVTGTNGKTTTTTLLGNLLQASGIHAVVAGNIGKAMSEALDELESNSLMVLEISSFQLHHISSFHPNVALLLNLSPDHLERYSTLGQYYEAKMRIFENMGPSDLAILNADDPETVSRSAMLRDVRVLYFGAAEHPEHIAYLEGSRIMVRNPGGEPRRVIEASRLRIPGRHNLENALAAVAAASVLGARTEAMEEALAGFSGLPHRLEIVLTVDGVRYINDSKATTVDSVRRALEALDTPVVLIMGGRHKGSSYAPLAALAGQKVRRLVVLGEAAEMIAAELSATVPTNRAPDLERAVAVARNAACSGDTILLSPGCSSFDMYGNYEERGKHFKEIVRGTGKNDQR